MVYWIRRSPVHAVIGRRKEIIHLSGGMSQQAMVAIALACRPALSIADESSTTLDVTTQAQILALVRELQKQTVMALLLITHNMVVVAEMCDEVAVMYTGKISEQAPRHSYTQGLLQSMPARDRLPRTPLPAIPGTAPDRATLPSGCRFRDRFPRAIAACAGVDPLLMKVAPRHRTACFPASEEVP